MDVRDQLKLYRAYYALVQDDKLPPLLCRVDDGILLYYVDDNDDVFLKCLGCDKITYPGVAQEREIRGLVQDNE